MLASLRIASPPYLLRDTLGLFGVAVLVQIVEEVAGVHVVNHGATNIFLKALRLIYDARDLALAMEQVDYVELLHDSVQVVI